MTIKWSTVKSKAHLLLLYNWVFWSNSGWKSGLNMADWQRDTRRAAVLLPGSSPSFTLCLCHLAPSYKYVMMFNAGVKKRDLPESVQQHSSVRRCIAEEGLWETNASGWSWNSPLLLLLLYSVLASSNWWESWLLEIISIPKLVCSSGGFFDEGETSKWFIFS